MQLLIERIDSHELKSFIKKLLPIDKFIFMKVGEDNVSSSVYFPERDAVKQVNFPTETMFNTKIKTPIKISFYNGSKVIDALSHFGSEVQGLIKFSEINDELMASDFTLKTDDLSINLACADPSLSFMEMTEDESARAFGTDEYLFQFDLLPTHVEQMKSLFNLDKDEEVFTLQLSERGVDVKGNSYNSNVTHAVESKSSIGSNVIVYKKYINLLDKENYRVIVCENKVVFRSLDTATTLTVAVAIVDEDYDYGDEV